MPAARPNVSIMNTEPSLATSPQTPRERRIALEGAINFRDLGGYPTRDGRRIAWGRLYRSDALCSLSASDLERIEALGLRTVCDLRSEEERGRRPNRLPEQGRTRTVAVGFMPHGARDVWDAISRGELGAESAAQHMLGHYSAFVETHACHFASLIDTLLQAEALPALIHCASGKDRTGFGVAAILLALGVSRETILSDYIISDRHRRDLSYLFGTHIDPRVYEAVAAAPANYLLASFERIDQGWGGEDRYLREVLRLDDERRLHLQSLLLEDA